MQRRVAQHIVWKGTPKDARKKFVDRQRSLVEVLCHTGSMTRKLKDLTESEMSVDRDKVKGLDFKWEPFGMELLQKPVLNRQILLRTTSDIPVLYASSWWNADKFSEIMTNPELPMWYNLKKNGIDSTPDIHSLFAIDCPSLTSCFGDTSEVHLGREYTLRHHGIAICIIIEVLSNNLYQFDKFHHLTQA